MPLSLRRTRGSGRCRWLLAALLTLTLVLPLGPLAPALDAAVVGEGRGFSWGENEHGQLGDFDGGNDSRTPVPVDGARRFIAVSAGGNHSLAVAADGTVWSWGLNSSGELGIGGSFIFPHDVPTQVEPTWPTGTVIVAVAAGQAHSLALTSDGTVWTWGDNSSGQLGNSDGGNDSGVPTKVGNTGPGGHVIARIAAGGFFSLALTNTGAVYTWGENGSGQLGNNDVTNTDLDQLSATLNFGGATIVAIAGGG